MQQAYAAPRGGPIIAAAYQDVPTFGKRGRATLRLVALSPLTGEVSKVFFSKVVSYRSVPSRDEADVTYQGWMRPARTPLSSSLDSAF